MKALKVSRQVDNWNDDRLDELAKDVKTGFDKVDKRFDKVEGEMKEGFEKADQRLERAIQSVCEQMREGFAKLEGQIAAADGRSEARMDRLEDCQEKLQYWIWGIGATLVVGVIIHFV